MAPKITGSSNRSKRSTKKPITKGQNPQRANRQRVSQAQVSSDSNRTRTNSARVTNSLQRTNTGSARVTGGERPALPPGRRGGDMVKAPNTKPQGTGGPVEQVRVRDLGSRKPGQVSGTPNRPAVPAGNKGGPVTLYQSRRPFRQTGPGDVPRPSAAKPASKVTTGRGGVAAAAIAGIAEPIVAAAGPGAPAVAASFAIAAIEHHGRSTAASILGDQACSGADVVLEDLVDLLVELAQRIDEAACAIDLKGHRHRYLLEDRCAFARSPCSQRRNMLIV